MRSTIKKSGFTLVELLVVIAIIGTLMGLLLPAVQSAREAGRRNTCSNNLSQMGKAFVSFDGRNGTIPGWRNSIPLANGSSIVVSWPVVIMPNLERRDVYRAWESGTSTPAPYIDLLVCPSTPPDSNNQPWISYVGNCGTGEVTSQNQFKGNGVLLDTVGTAGTVNAARINLDVIGNADGTASTVLMSEKCGVAATSQGNWNIVNFASTTSGFNNGVTTTSTPGFGIPASGSPPTRVINQTTATGLYPSSNHPGGVMSVFCDGHTMFLKDSISAQVYAQLLTSNQQALSPQASTLVGSYILNEGDIK
jgi:prepilin-type N-terminal cleavage/methylation domain-containing protein/prepilin-type processing-associated H-X9-DG protein